MTVEDVPFNGSPLKIVEVAIQDGENAKIVKIDFLFSNYLSLSKRL